MSRAVTFCIIALWTSLLAAPANAQNEGELKERMKNRYRELLPLITAGKIGETASGLVDAVKPEFLAEKVDVNDPESVTVKVLVDQENQDRRRAFDLIAQRTNAPVEAVSRKAGERAFAKALPEQFLKTPEGRWVQKKDLKQ